jgi:hypothetical protein
MTNLRFAAVVPWCREAAVPVLVLACIATTPYAPYAGVCGPSVDSFTQAPGADVKIDDVKVEESGLNASKPDDSNNGTASDTDKQQVADTQPAAQPAMVDLASASPTKPEVAHLQVASAALDAIPVPSPEPPAAAAPDPIVTAALTDPAEALPGDAATEPLAIQSVAPTQQPSDAGIEIVDDCIVLETCVDRYLWTLYKRAPKEDSVKVEERRQVTIKRRGKHVTVTRTFSRVTDEDFAWKDPKAATKCGMSIEDYVIGGVDADFKLRLFQMLHAAEQAGLAPGITSAFRDDYRQSIASGLKAADNRSYHGGSLHGGYGHGLAADIVSIKGATRAERLASTNILWKWIDANGKDFGIGRPYMNRDPPHVAPIDGEEYAKHRPSMKQHLAHLMAKLRKLALGEGRGSVPQQRTSR